MGDFYSWTRHCFNNLFAYRSYKLANVTAFLWQHVDNLTSSFLFVEILLAVFKEYEDKSLLTTRNRGII